MKKLNNVVKIIAIPYFIIEVLANFDGAISFLNRFGMYKQQIDTMIEAAKILSHLIHSLLPLGFLYVLYKNYNTIEKIKALKDFRDKESIFLTNRFNSSISSIASSNGMTNNNDNSNDELYQIHGKEIDKYNEAFKDWKMGDYGLGNNTTAKKHTPNK